MPTPLPDRPRRVEGLEVTEIADGLVVHQSTPERVHHLNNTASVVFALCDGSCTITEIAALVGETFTLPAPPLAACTSACRRCDPPAWCNHPAGPPRRTPRTKLSAVNEPASPDPIGDDRRRFLKKMGLAAFAVPAIATFSTTGIAAWAGSNRPLAETTTLTGEVTTTLTGEVTTTLTGEVTTTLTGEVTTTLAETTTVAEITTTIAPSTTSTPATTTTTATATDPAVAATAVAGNPTFTG